MKDLRNQGITAALVSALFLGLSPIFGKQSILLGFTPLAVVALRTSLATGIMFITLLIFKRSYLYIYPAGMAGCFLAGALNGLGSIFYYDALSRIDVGVGQLLYAMYPLFMVLWMLVDKQIPSRFTIVRIIIAFLAVVLLTQANNGEVNWLGTMEMLAASALYALHIPINQRVLYDMPAQTVTLYTLFAMSAVVVTAYFLAGATLAIQPIKSWFPIIGLTLVTYLSRLTLFLGVKHLGGLQTALLGLGELLVAILFAYILLGERMNPQQWAGALLLITSLVLVGIDKKPPIISGAKKFVGLVR